MARQRNNSLDGGWSEVSFFNATKMRKFPVIVAMDKQMFRVINEMTLVICNSSGDGESQNMA